MGLSGYQPSHPSSWVYQATKEVERLTTKLVSSLPEIWTPTPDLAWLLNIYTPNTRKHPPLSYTVPWTMPSLLVLFRVCKEENQPSRLVFEVPSHNRFIKQVQTPFPFPKLAQMSSEDVHTTISILGLTKRNRCQGIHTHTKQLRNSRHCLS